MRNFKTFFWVILTAIPLLSTILFCVDPFNCFPSNQSVYASPNDDFIDQASDDLPDSHQKPNHPKKPAKHNHSFLLKLRVCVLFKHSPTLITFFSSAPGKELKYPFENNMDTCDIVCDITHPPPEA